MKGAIFSVVLAAAGGLVNAQIYRRQNFAGEPSCAIPCLEAAISSAGCAPSDEACQCDPATIAVLGGYAGPCLITACAASDVIAAESVGLALCSAYSASLSGVSATTTTSAPTTSSTGSSASTASSTSTTAASTTTSIITTTSAPATTTKANSTILSKTSTTPPPVSSTGGANTIMAGLGGVAGLVAAFVAAL